LSSNGEYVRLETIGRRTNAPHDVLVRFITVDAKVVVFPQNQGRQDWVANIRKNPRVRVFGAGGTLEGHAQIRQIVGLKDPLLSIFTRKYGESEVRKRYWGQTRYIDIEITSQSSAADYDELFYSDVEAAFDGVAENYDEHILGNPMNLWLRNRSVNHLSKIFRPGEVVLEVGCGTGTETISLAKHGVRIIASDISSKMLEVLARKAKEAGLSDMIVPVHARTYALKERLKQMGFDEIDGAYSTYGAINTEPRLGGLFQDLHSIIRPEGYLVLGVWNKYCLYEMLGYTLKLNPSMAFARLRNPVPVGKSRFCITSYAYSVSSLKKYVTRLFRLRKVYGVQILLPASNLIRYLPPEPFLSFIKKVDVALESHYPWNNLGDHFLSVYSRM
jgi:deazaflavin-dependent oxidoreductase (nitroreductase family)